MRTRILAVLISLSVAMAACQAQRVPAAVEWRGHTFQEVRVLADLPTIMQSELGVGRPGLGGIADRGLPFNVTDVVDRNLPMRRFLAAGVDGDIWLVALERGGLGYSVEVFLFSSREATPKQKWVLLCRPKTLSEVVQQLVQKNGVRATLGLTRSSGLRPAACYYYFHVLGVGRSR